LELGSGGVVKAELGSGNGGAGGDFEVIFKAPLLAVEDEIDPRSDGWVAQAAIEWQALQPVGRIAALDVIGYAAGGFFQNEIAENGGPKAEMESRQGGWARERNFIAREINWASSGFGDGENGGRRLAAVDFECDGQAMHVGLGDGVCGAGCRLKSGLRCKGLS